MTVQLTPDVRSRLDQHLDAVERALAAAGNPRERRRGVVDDLEAQIMDMLAAKSAAPTAGDLDAVLGGLDPPAAYGETPGAQPASGAPISAPGLVPGAGAASIAGSVKRPRYSRTAIGGFVCIVLSLLPIMPVLVVGFFVGATSHQRVLRSEQQSAAFQSVASSLPAAARPALPQPTTTAAATAPAAPSSVGVKSFLLLPCLGISLAPLGLLGTVLGWIAVVQIRGSKGALHGMGLALFDGLFYPVAILLLLLVALIMPLR